MSSGPLVGVRVLELGGIGPGPFCGMLLADLGADVVTVARADAAAMVDRSQPARNPLERGKRSVAVDLKDPAAIEAVLALVERADVLIDPFRPGVCERLGLGPQVCAERNPRLIFGRMTGYGQEGPMARVAGHDIDYIALAGALEPIGRAGERPVPPLNALGDFGGGGMLLALGIVAALHERATSGRGQVIDAAMIDGAALLMAPFYSARASGGWGPRGTNMIDTGAHFYEVYECADGGYVAVGSVEPPFYAELLARLGLDPAEWPQWDRGRWPELKERLAALFATQPRAHWCELLEGTESCFAPVLTPVEAPSHPHHRARGTFVDVDGVVQPHPAPRFSRTPATVDRPPCHPGEHQALLDRLWTGGDG